ncbi:hypothetical protein EON65_14470 [archaeon]|nr:MAG: hypothetical protein EON65_14470 [archaeon]
MYYLYREKAERQNDPNVEYVDMEDFKPGGKYAPNTAEVTASEAEGDAAVSEELRKAAGVLAQAGELKKTNILSSSLWTELLD